MQELQREMADEDYQTKLRELQKYVPFLENTIRRLKAEKDRPREAQISKLQSLLSILTDTKKKLKLDALKKCEEVILKLYDKVEKRPCDMINANKYRCRTPPESVVPTKNASPVKNATFVAAREKLKRIETPTSPSPPRDAVSTKVALPVKIPTEKVETSPVRDSFHNIPNPHDSPKKIPTIVHHFVGPPHQKPQWPNKSWPLTEPQLSSIKVKKMKDLDRPKEHSPLWKNNENNPAPRAGREIIDYSDIPANFNPSPPHVQQNKSNNKVISSLVNKKPKKISFKVEKSKKSLLSPKPTINKTAFIESDCLGLISPLTETSSSGEHSPLHPEELSLDKLEALKAKLYRELEESKNTDKSKGKENKTIVDKAITKMLKPAPISSNATEKKAKEQDHNFGNLLSSIDDEIISKTNQKKDKKEYVKLGEKKESPSKRDKEKDNRSSSDSSRKSSKSSDKKSVDLTKKETAKPSSDFSKKDKKLMETVLKKVQEEDVSKKDKKLMETVLKNVEKPKPKNAFEEFSNKLMQNVQEAIKLVNDKKEEMLKNNDPVINKDDPVINKDDPVINIDIPLPKEVKKDVLPVKLPEGKPRITAADIMRDLEESIGISKMEDPLEKFGDLVKQKSSSLHRLNMNDEIIKKNLVVSDLDFPLSGRLSDKYPHKRKISTDTRISDPTDFDIGSYNEMMLSPKSKLESQAMKLSDPRLSDPRLSDPRLRMNPIKKPLLSPEPNFPTGPKTNPYCAPNHFSPISPPECHNNPPFAFPNNFPPGHLGNQNQGNFFHNSGRSIEPLNIGNRAPIDPFLNPGNMTPVDPFLNPGSMTPVETFFDAPKLPPQLMGQNFPPPNGPNFPNNFNNMDQRNSGNIWDHAPNSFEPNPQNIFQNSFNKNQNNPRFPVPGNQYDLSQVTPLDFFDQNQDNPEFNRGRGFRAPLLPSPRVGSSNFNNHGRGDLRHNKYVVDNRRNKSDRGVTREVIRDVSKDITKDDSYNKRSSKYNDPRLSKEKDKDDYRNRRKSVDERSSSKSVSEVVKKPETTTIPSKPEVEPVSDIKKTENNYSPLDSLYSGVTKTMGKGYGLQKFKIPKIRKPEVVEIKKEIKKEEEKKALVVSKKEEVVEKVEKPEVVKKSESSEVKKTEAPEVVKKSESSEVKKTEAPEVKKIEASEVKKIEAPEVKKIEAPVTEAVPLIQELKREPEKVTEQTALKTEVSSSDEKREQIEVATTCKEETETNADEKLDMFNKFMKHIFDTCNSSVLLDYLDKCGFSLPQSKTKRIRRIIESDSSESEEEPPKEKPAEDEKPGPEPVEVPEKVVEEIEESKEEDEISVETSSEVSLNPEMVIESVGERIKNRRRKNIIYSSDSSPDKNKPETSDMSPPQTPEKRVTRKGKLGKKTEKPVLTTKKTARRKNALELLQDDIREMFISEGVITATGKRMCRLMKEHQEIDFNSSQSEIDSPMKKPAAAPEDEEEVPLMKRKPKPRCKITKGTGKSSPKPVRIMPKRNSTSPRVVLEKLQFVPPQDKSETDNSSAAEEQSEEEPEVVNKKKQPIRKLPSRAKKPTKLVDKESDSEDVSPVRKPVAVTNKTNKKTSPELPKEVPESEETDEDSESEAEKEDGVTEKPIRRKTRKRKGNNWSAGVIRKRVVKKPAVIEKPSPTPAPVTSTPNPSDDLEIDDQEVADLVADASQDLKQLQQVISNRMKEKSEQPKVVEKDEVDLIPDVHYYLHGTGKFDCKLCNFKGRYIVNHYKTVHPDSEIMISRLSPDQARAAIIEAEQFSLAGIVPYDEVIGGKKRRTNFMCRVCTTLFKDAFVGAFYDHVSSHTGEHRYFCAVCSFNTASKRTLHAHCETKHTHIKRPISIFPTIKAPPNFRIVFGYLCKACNFVQLRKENIEKHIKVYHPDQEIEIVKVSMSSKPVPLTDLQTETTESDKTPAEVKKEILQDYKAEEEEEEEEEDDNSSQTSTRVVEPEKNESQIDMEDLISKTAITKRSEPESRVLVIKKSRDEEEKPVENIPELQKEPNMTVFMVSESEYSEQEKLIESERLKKMQEVHNNINPKRSSLNVVNKLQNKLATILEADDSLCQELKLLESMEDEAAHKALEDTVEDEILDVGLTPLQEEQQSQEASTSSLTTSESDQQSSQWLSISSACSLATGEQTFDANVEEALASESQTQSSDNESNSEEIDVNQVDLPLTMDNKQKGVFDTIYRLAAQLKSSPTAPSTTEETDNSDLYYKPDESSTSSEPIRPQSPPLTNLNVVNAGIIEIIGSNVQQIFRYKCRVPKCTFQSRYKKHFTSHLSEAHKTLMVTCPICVEQAMPHKLFNMMNLFVHVIYNHMSDLTTTKKVAQVKQEPVEMVEPPKIEIISKVEPPALIVEPIPPQPGTIRIRRISGDVLSSFSSPKPVDVVPTPTEPQPLNLQTQEVFLHIPESSDHSSENSSEAALPALVPFLQISDVRTLTPEEENHLQLKIAEDAIAVNKKSIKTYKPVKHLKLINKTEIPVNILKSQKIQTIDLAKDLKYFSGANISAMTAKTYQIAKTNAVVAKMLRHPQILDLYKCPMSTCAYSTSLKKNFNFHFNDRHKDSTAFDAYCVYCNCIIEKTKISNHIDEEHGYCGYQCMNCFYRALTLIYVSLHQKSAHNTTGNPKCYSLLSPPTSQKSFDNILPINQAIPPYVCDIAPCSNIYYITSDYIKHLLDAHSKNIYCSICNRSNSARNEFISIPAFLSHLLDHKIGRFQCRYCVFGAEAVEVMLQHYTMDHCNKQPVSYLRKYMKGYYIEPTSGSIINLEKLLKVNLEQLLQANMYRPRKQLGPIETQNIVPPAKSSIFSAKAPSPVPAILLGSLTSSSVLLVPSRPSVTPPIASVTPPIASVTPPIASVTPPIASVTPSIASATPPPVPNPTSEQRLSVLKSANPSANPIMIEILEQDELPELPASQSTIELSSQESSTTEVDTTFQEPLVTLKHRSNETKTAIENAIDPLNLDYSELVSETDLNLVDLSEESEYDVLTDSSISIKNYVRELTGKDLFRCGNVTCGASFENGSNFKTHLFNCDISKNFNGLYQCYHCHRQWKVARALLEHIMQHSILPISCSLCGKKDYHARLMKRHFLNYHKMPCRMVPVDPKNTTVFDSFICEPMLENDSEENQKKQENLVQIVEEPLDESPVSSPTIPMSTSMFKNVFGPEDIDRLPRPPVYAQEVKCKVCSYATKVRSNILKHLKAHFENKAVSEQAPVNPVPCLEKNEMMFEKMTNLAASSQSTSRMGGKKKEDKPESKQEVDNTYPGFVPINKRYVCGANNCNYLTHGESMLRHHLTALHLGETSYKCPHCNLCLTRDEIDCLAIDNIMFHLKMHDLYLYHCPVCQYYHYQKHKIKRHILDLHKSLSGERNTEIVRELDSSANVDESRTSLPLKKMAEVLDVTLDGPSVLAWRCGFCPYKCATRAEMVQHCTIEHKIKSQYKCALCHFKCSVKPNYNNHFKTKHPNEKVNFVNSYYKLTEAELNSGSLLSQNSSVDELSEESDKSSFDTTPLWVKNKTGIKHIRGILLDDSKSTTTTRKIPKVIEKLNELKFLQESSTSSLETVNSSPVKTYSSVKTSPVKESVAKMSKDVVRLPDTYGNAYQNFYCCPSCQLFKTQKIKEFINHIYEEINYYRFVCTICGAKFLEMAEASNHFSQNHKDNKIVTGKTLSVMRFNGRVEKWIEKCLKEQQQEVEAFLKAKPETQTQDLNSSTETLVLNLDDDDEEEEEERSEQRLSLGKESSDDDFPSIPLSSLAEKYRLEKVNTGLETTKIKQEASEEVISTTTISRLPEKKKIGPEVEVPPVLSSENVLEDLPLVLEPEVDVPITMNPLECEYCDYVARTSMNIKRHVKTHFAIKKYQCHYCSYKGAAMNHLQTHFDARHKELPLSFTLLSVPDKITPVAIKRKRTPTSTDLSEEVPAKVARIIKTENSEDDMCYMCFHCPRKSYDVEEIRAHYLSMHPNIINKGIWKYKKITTKKPKQFKMDCNLCNFSGSADSLRIHEAQEHAIEKSDFEKNVMHECNNCGSRYKSLSQLRRHITVEHKREPFSYQTITVLNGVESIENVEIVEESINLEEEETKVGLNCEYCPDNFVDQEQLSNHHSLLHSHLELKLRKNSELKLYQCPECGHTSNSYNSIRDHLRSHNKPFSCGHCKFLGSYPNVLKAHHIKEHIGLELQIVVSIEAQGRVEKLREKLLHLQADGTYARKSNLKRAQSEPELRANKVFVVDASDNSNNPQDSFISTTSNVAKKSTSKPPQAQSVAKKSTTPRPTIVEGFSYYGCQPPNISDYKQVTCELPIMGKNMPLQVQAMSQILNLFPTVCLEDIFKTT